MSAKKTTNQKMRLNQYIAHAGICSRREADKLIEAGVIKINGTPMIKMGYRVNENDIVKFNGELIRPESKKYLLLNKPKNFSTRVSNQGKKNSVFDLLQVNYKEKLFPIGGINKKTSGLVLFTNDDKISRKLSHPRNKIKKIYHVSLNKNLKSKDLKTITTINDFPFIINNISYIKGKEKSEIGIEIKSYHDKALNNLFEDLGYKIIGLDLVYFGGLTKKDIPRKKYRCLTKQEINILKRL